MNTIHTCPAVSRRIRDVFRNIQSRILNYCPYVLAFYPFITVKALNVPYGCVNINLSVELGVW